MFKRFFEKMAGKASLTNIKFDLDNLQQSFPHSSSAASKYLFNLLENITLARENGMSDADVTTAIQSKVSSPSPELQQIVTAVHKLVVASASGNSDRISQLDAEINRVFRDTTGSPLNVSKAPLLTRINIARERA